MIKGRKNMKGKYANLGPISCKYTTFALNTFLTCISAISLKLYAFIFLLKGEIAPIGYVKCH